MQFRMVVAASQLVNLNFINHEVTACNRLEGQIAATGRGSQVEGVFHCCLWSLVESNQGIVIAKVNFSQHALVNISDTEFNTLECARVDGPLEDIHPLNVLQPVLLVLLTSYLVFMSYLHSTPGKSQFVAS